jgi:rhodanese-related sulfurtransferase
VIWRSSSSLLILGALALAACQEEERALPHVDYAAVSAPSEVRAISAIDLAVRIEAGDVLLVDVREPEEFAESRIAGALNAPLSTFDPAMIPREQARETIFYCRSGRRSAEAAQMMAERFGGTVRHLEGGITEWIDSGRDTVPQADEAPSARD